MGQIVWLASYPKSGNTWLRVFLHNYILRPATPHSINALTDFSVSETAAALYRPHDPRLAGAYSTAEVQRMRPLVHRDLTRLHDDLVFVKTHNAALEVHGTPLCTWEVTAGAIYLVRDPRDVAVAYSLYTGRGIARIIDFMSQSDAASKGGDEQVFERLGSWSDHAASWLARPKILPVRYEDLLAAPEPAFARIVRFLGSEAAEPERLRQAIAHSELTVLAAQERRHGYAAAGPNKATPFFRAGQAGRWRDYLTAAEARQIESAHGEMMARFGYRLEG